MANVDIRSTIKTSVIITDSLVFGQNSCSVLPGYMPINSFQQRTDFDSGQNINVCPKYIHLAYTKMRKVKMEKNI